MANILEGLQFREPNPQLPSWNTDKYGNWKDIKGENVFSSGTQFRVAPKIVYIVSDANDKKVLTSKDKNVAMAKVSSMLAEEHFSAIRTEERPIPTVSTWLSERNIQYKAFGADKWVHAQYFSNHTGISSRIQFRVRPDTYFHVDIKNGIAMSSIDFDDVDALTKYLDRQIRTSENNIVITRRAYGISI